MQLKNLKKFFLKISFIKRTISIRTCLKTFIRMNRINRENHPERPKVNYSSYTEVIQSVHETSLLRQIVDVLLLRTCKVQTSSVLKRLLRRKTPLLLRSSETKPSDQSESRISNNDVRRKSSRSFHPVDSLITNTDAQL